MTHRTATIRKPRRKIDLSHGVTLEEYKALEITRPLTWGPMWRHSEQTATPARWPQGSALNEGGAL